MTTIENGYRPLRILAAGLTAALLVAGCSSDEPRFEYIHLDGADQGFTMPYTPAIKVNSGKLVFVSGVTAAPVYHSHPHVASEFMDKSARTISEDLDLLGMAQLFLTTPYRRLPVVTDGRLVGQVSRRDVLTAAHGIFPVAPPLRERKPLYLSSLVDMDDAPIE